ncbi:MAG TPA: NAD+ synthase [Elusimicrobia bacterium]|nr:NAD+ synthase [Elusimicrobiota bacterium]
MKIAVAQINPKVGDIEGNLARIKKFALAAASAGAEISVFPELTLTGYPPLDLLEREDFIKANLTALKKLAAFRIKTAIVVGCVDFNPSPKGKALLNCAALVAGGKVIALRAKSLLPTYDIFDEARYFEPAGENRPVIFNGQKLGLTICEDIWAGTELLPKRLLYRNNPAETLSAGKADIIINISASPYYYGKTAKRFNILSNLAKKTGKIIVYANQTGANDELIFDGNSFILDAKGFLAAKALSFREDLILADTARGHGRLEFILPPKGEELGLALTLGIRDYFLKSGHSKAVLGLSGGIDSAVVAALAARALGPGNVTALLMPSPFTSAQSVSDALELVKNLGINSEILPIKNIYSAFCKTLGGARNKGVPLYMQNLQSRARGTLLMARANIDGALALVTGNKSEIAMGYCTLYGDTAGALAPLADLVKEDVYAVSDWLNSTGRLIPRSIILRPPTAELKPGQKDSDDLPQYKLLDRLIRLYIERNKTPSEIAGILGLGKETVIALLKRLEANEYKRKQLPTGLKVSEKSFGSGRKMPLAKAMDFIS